MEVCHITVGAVGTKKQNGVLAVTEELVQEHAKQTRVRVISIVKSKRVSLKPGFSYNKFGPKLFFVLYRLVKSKTFFFHIHGALNVHLNIICVFLWIFNASYCISPHGAFSKRNYPTSLLKKAFIRTVVVWTLKHAKFVHIFGDRDTYLINKYLKEITLFVAPNGIRPNPKQHIRNKNRSGCVKIRLGFCGRVNYKEKGLDLLPEVFQNLMNNGKMFSFDLIGTGPDQINFSNEIKKRGLNKYVTYHGALFGADKLSLLSDIDIFLHPSRNEGMPLAPLEALALGSRTLISIETNLERYLNGIDGIFIISTRDPKDWSDTIIEASNTNLNIEMVNKIFKTTLAWPKIAEDFLRQYEKYGPN